MPASIQTEETFLSFQILFQNGWFEMTGLVTRCNLFFYDVKLFKMSPLHIKAALWIFLDCITTDWNLAWVFNIRVILLYIFHTTLA